jgi:hypothetical protein
MPEISYSQCALLLECPKCQVINYMDPFSFWIFTGKTKCAGYAQTKDYKKEFVAPDKVSPPSYARPPDQKHGPTYKNVRGKPVSAGKLTASDLVGSRPRFILEGKPYQPAS